MCAGSKRSTGVRRDCSVRPVDVVVQTGNPYTEGTGDEGASMSAADHAFGLRDSAVRRCLLAVSVLHDLDLTWDDRTRKGRTRRDGVRSPADGLPDVHVDGPAPVLMRGTRLARL